MSASTVFGSEPAVVAPIVQGGVNEIVIAISDTGDHILHSGLILWSPTAVNPPGSGVVITQPGTETEGDDLCVSSALSEQFDLKGGDDIAHGAGGDDVMSGGAGRDLLYGGSDESAVSITDESIHEASAPGAAAATVGEDDGSLEGDPLAEATDSDDDPLAVTGASVTSSDGRDLTGVGCVFGARPTLAPDGLDDLAAGRNVAATADDAIADGRVPVSERVVVAAPGGADAPTDTHAARKGRRSIGGSGAAGAASREAGAPRRAPVHPLREGRADFTDRRDREGAATLRTTPTRAALAACFPAAAPAGAPRMMPVLAPPPPPEPRPHPRGPAAGGRPRVPRPEGARRGPRRLRPRR